MNQLKAENLSFKYPKSASYTIKDISFTAYEGRITALIGPNGAGKTTVIKALVGILKSEGRIYINGEQKSGRKSNILMNEISYLTQEGNILSGLSVFECVLIGKVGSLRLKVSDADLEKVWSTLNILHIESIADRPYYALSGGQRKIVNIAQAIVKDPEILILDEPTANLDMQKELEVMELVSSYTKAMKTVTLVTLHDLNTACRFADDMVLLKNGSIFSSGFPKDVITKESIEKAYGVESDVVLGEDLIPHVHPKNSVRKTQFCFDRF